MADDPAAMFDIGMKYRITTGTGENEGSSSFTVVAYEAPLLKVKAGDDIIIFNTSSPSFVMAEREVTEDERIARLADLPDYLKPSPAPNR